MENLLCEGHPGQQSQHFNECGGEEALAVVERYMVTRFQINSDFGLVKLAALPNERSHLYGVSKI